MVAIGSGIATQITSLAESTYGVAPTYTGQRSYEIKSETLELKKTTVQGQGLHGGGLYDRARRRVLTNYEATGGLVMDLPTRQMAYWIQHMLGSYSYVLTTPTQVGSSGIYRSVNWPGSLLGHSFSLQKGVPDISGNVDPFTYVGCKISDWELKCSVGAIAELTLNIDARNELAGTGNTDPLNGSVPGLASFGLPTSGLGSGVFHFREATIFTGGTPTVTSNVVALSGEAATTNVKDIDIKHSVKLDSQRIFLGAGGFKAEQIENGFRSITGTMTVEWLSSEAMYNAFAADTTTSLQLTFTGPTVSTSNYLLDIIIPNIKLDGESPKVPGPAVVTQSVSFTGLDDEATTQIQIVYQSEDSVV